MSETETLPPPSPVDCDSAERQAFKNRLANLAAMSASQPWLVSAEITPPPSARWIFARDGSLTAMLEGERWWAGCSVPAKAAEFMFRSMDVGGPIACFLNPLHAAQVRVALDRLEPSHSIVAIVPDPRTLAVLLHCENFSSDIAAGRLWWVTGDGWADGLDRLFEDNPGLPTPSQFIRPIAVDGEAAIAIIGPAQEVFATVGKRRVDKIQTLLKEPKQVRSPRRICILAPSRFRLWEDAGIELAELALSAPDIQVLRVELDRPTSASPLALALAAAQSDAILAANICRSNAPGMTPGETPWITWMTQPRVPAPSANGAADWLLVADPAWAPLALAAGWPGERVRVGAIPSKPAGRMEAVSARGALHIIADTRPLAIPERVRDYSSQVLLWEMIEAEIAHDPFSLGDLDQYLESRRTRLKVSEEGFDRAVFLERLILPAFQQNVARHLAREKLPIQIYGKGWESIADLSSLHVEPVASRTQLADIASSSIGLIHLWPGQHPHPIDSFDRPVVRAFGCSRGQFMDEVRKILAGAKPPARARPGPALSAELLREILGF